MRAGFTTALRVYEPLAALPPAERSRWTRYAERRDGAEGTGPGLDTATAVRSEHETALSMVVRPRLDVAEEHALVREVDGLPYVCPLDTQRRVWESLIEFRDGLADLVADAFVPRRLAEEAETELGRWQAATDPEGMRPPHVLTATWHVPLAWFLVVDVADRELVLGDGLGDPSRSLTYTTTMAAARRRGARALALLQRTIPEAPTVRGLEQVGRWLEEFHPYSRVQLDYGDLVTILDDAFLSADTSAADLAEGLAALRAGDVANATGAYERVVTRWRPVQAKETSS